jgi:hypothetical protein
MLWAVLGLAAIALAVALFVSPSVAITGGQVDEHRTYSNVGTLVYLPPDGSPPVVAFSGTLIHPRVFLTAAHTAGILEANPEIIPFCRISFGTYALDPSTWHEIVAGIAHPDYDAFRGASPDSNDVGVIVLKNAVNTRKVPLAKLPRSGYLHDLAAAGLLREPGQGGTPFVLSCPPLSGSQSLAARCCGTFVVTGSAPDAAAA